MRDLQLDSSGDLLVSEFDLAFVAGADQAAQRIGIALRLFQGEWFLDLDAGLPWFDQLLGKNLDLRQTESVLRREILNTPDVNAITAFSLDYDPRARTLTVAFTADTIFGAAAFKGNVP